jgi:malonyl-CoA O-methyltransferase
MSINKSLVQKHFDMHAQEYDHYAKVQAHMASHLLQHVQSLFNAEPTTKLAAQSTTKSSAQSTTKPSAQSTTKSSTESSTESSIESSIESSNEKPLHIFEIGCGTGYLTQLLLEHYPQAQLTVLDISATMLATLQLKLAHHAHRIQMIHADAETYEIDRSLSYDLVISNATFQWFSDSRSTIERYIPYVRLHGCFAFATFAPRTFQELHESFASAQQQLQLPTYRYGQHYLTETEWRDIFAQYDAKCFTWHQEMCYEYYPTVRQFLYAIQRIGAANANLKENSNIDRNPISKQLLKQMESNYEARYTSDQGIRVTYDIGYGLYQKRESCSSVS